VYATVSWAVLGLTPVTGCVLGVQVTGELSLVPPDPLPECRGGMFCDEPVSTGTHAVHGVLIMNSHSSALQKARHMWREGLEWSEAHVFAACCDSSFVGDGVTG
jgi:hypothetical protein